MRSELQFVLDSLRSLSPDELPELLGELEVIRATALLKISAPAPAPAHDKLLKIREAAERLGMSTDYVYTHADQFPFTKREGRSLKFSSQGIDAYIRKKSR